MFPMMPDFSAASNMMGTTMASIRAPSSAMFV